MAEYKEIPLTQGKVALVDAEDFEYLNQWKWCAYYSGYTWYAMKKIRIAKKEKDLKMHRLIVNPPDNMEVDHINGSGLDNRKENLRICTHSQNHMNSRRQSNNTSGYKGVCFYKRVKKWIAYIKYNKKRVHLGYFNAREDAALAYNEAARKYHGEFARLNKFEEARL